MTFETSDQVGGNWCLCATSTACRRPTNRCTRVIKACCDDYLDHFGLRRHARRGAREAARLGRLQPARATMGAG